MGRRADRRSDVFSLGIVLWELVTGLQLFRGRSLLDVHQAVLQQEIESPDVHRLDLPGPISAVIVCALARKADDRYANADLFARGLRKAAAIADVDLAGTSQIARFVSDRASASVDGLTRSIRESATPSSQRTELPAEEEPTTLDLPAKGGPAVPPTLARSSIGPPTAVRWWRAFLRWLGLR